MANTLGDIQTVLRIRPFRRLWTVLGLASFGDWLAIFATAGFAQSLFDDPAAKGAAFSATIVLRLLPSLLLGPVAGVFADRFDRRKTMAACDIARFLLIGSVPTVYLITDSTAFTVAWLAVAQLCIEGAVLIWSPAKEAAVPNLLPPEKYEAANQLSLATTYGLAPPLAFAVLAVLERGSNVWSNLGSWAEPMVIALYLTAAMFAILAVTVYFFIPQISGRYGQFAAKTTSVWHDFVEGWSYMRSAERVRGLIVGMLGAFSGAGVLIGVGTVYASTLGAGDAAFYTLAVFLFLGLGAGIAFGPKLIGELSRLRWFGMSIVLAGAGLALDAVAPHMVFAAFGSVVIGLGAGMAFLAGITLLQRETEDEIRGRMFAFIAVAARVILMLAMTISAPLAGWHAARQLDLGFTKVEVSMSRILLFVAAALVVWLGVTAFKSMDDKPGVPVLADLWSSLRGRPLTAPDPVAGSGFFVVFEGGEGAGKSTQAVKLAAWLKLRNYEAVLTREPGATDIGMRIRSLVLDSGGDSAPGPRAEALLYAADRAQHVEKVVRPALERGAVVVSDRYIDSSIAYQGSGRSLGKDDIAWVSTWATGGLKPDLTVLLDVDPEAGLRRAKAGGDGDRLEQEELEFHEKVRETFLHLAAAEPNRYLVVPAGGTPDEIAAQVRDAVAERLDIRTQTARADSGWPGLDSPRAEKADDYGWDAVAEEAGRP
ncbi:dTMP kinase [Glycomyces sp. TRM65418]|uniref:dTMP kinase n=1 Tax=Glycomyces sp. TRM65418 TaxID=2867006 RepID=UPI001CE5438D|nr:dTMP kinase [Glycomyces sp. TRM65418]MCC3762534.1 dTMP kinase [Glycomyces sp. TRM65418]QZD56574.1 dTMP kinase [Glycomyces sp. TRM65418]